ncbi:MAG TPA: nitroreductase family protein [Dissulfurispiraceae bacterium]|nr:nitroreductase family protein [Dissulfurispiraceae bacterium]
MTFRYHEETKHRPHRYARSAGFLDWPNEPHPFRLYEGAERFSLPLISKDPSAGYIDLYERGRNAFKPFSFENISKLLELSLGLSAWKSQGEASWALRMNPSSGNLHPTEAHLILPPLVETGGNAGVYHYNPYLHALERRVVLDAEIWSEIRQHFGVDGFFAGLSSIYWRESWKYGERAFRYCNHDVGHALTCLSFAGNLMGWKVTHLDSLSDRDIETLLGFRKTSWHKFERENPELILFIHPGSETFSPPGPNQRIIDLFEPLDFVGIPNRLSNDHKDWRIIDEVSEATEKSSTAHVPFKFRDYPFFANKTLSDQAAAVIRARRSATAFDAMTSMSKNNLFEILDRTIPRQNCAPFDIQPDEPVIHLFIFVHRIDGLDPGLHVLVRNEADIEELRKCCHEEFAWKEVAGAPEQLRFFLLKKGDYQSTAANAGCYQEIASDGVISVAMIAKFRNKIEQHPSDYRRLHWEAGMIGQVLYLEAEAHGMRGTGMGCFFDDVTHDIIGLSDNTFQDIYHFSIGKPVEDRRLSILPPYHHIAM